jgi:methionyl-tRNA formyltransferase
MKKSVLFLGSKPIGYQCFKYLVENSSALNIELKGLLTNDNRRFDSKLSLVDYANDHEIPIIDNLDDILDMGEVDLIISIQFHLLLKQKHIDVARDIAINLHMAPLPEYRGCNQFSFAIFNQDQEFGTTIHKLEKSMDAGPILAEKRFVIPENCFVNELYELTYDHSITLFKGQIGSIIEGKYKLTSQSERMEDRKCNTYFRKDIKLLKELSLHMSTDEIDRRLRATSMPGFKMPSITIKGNEYLLIPEHIYNVNDEK